MASVPDRLICLLHWPLEAHFSISGFICLITCSRCCRNTSVIIHCVGSRYLPTSLLDEGSQNCLFTWVSLLIYVVYKVPPQIILISDKWMDCHRVQINWLDIRQKLFIKEHHCFYLQAVSNWLTTPLYVNPWHYYSDLNHSWSYFTDIVYLKFGHEEVIINIIFYRLYLT